VALILLRISIPIDGNRIAIDSTRYPSQRDFLENHRLSIYLDRIQRENYGRKHIRALFRIPVLYILTECPG
jgi:hypothetical protein